REREEEGKFDSGPGAAGGIGAHFEGRGAGAQPCPGPQVPPARGFPLDPRPRAPPAGAGAGGELLPGEVGIIDLGVGEQAAAHEHRRGWGQAPARGTEFDDAPGIGTRDRCQVYPFPHAPRFADGGGTGRPHRRCCGRWGRCRHPGVDIPVWTARGYSSARAATGGTFVAERAGMADASRPAPMATAATTALGAQGAPRRTEPSAPRIVIAPAQPYASPPAIPTSAPTTAMITPSIARVPRSWDFVSPIARSVADSRRRSNTDRERV